MSGLPFLTDDGSHSLRSTQFGDAYHSTHGALQESRHIFLEAGLLPLLREPGRNALRVLEMGFGTGLNALLSREAARDYPSVQLDYTTYERYPVATEVAAALNYCDLLGISPDRLDQLHDAPWGLTAGLDANFQFTKEPVDFLAAELPAGAADLIYYDAFAPETQPELWTEEAMRHCARSLSGGGVLVTYCAKGQFKRNLRAAGFRVEALPGPVGKREITRAYLVDLA